MRNIAERIFCLGVGVASLGGSGLSFIFGTMVFMDSETVFQELIGACFCIIGAALLTSAGVWVIIDQNERTFRERQYWDPALLFKLAKAIEEIRDRGYDVVDRLDQINQIDG